MRFTVGVICVVNIILWYFEVGLRSEVSFTYEQNIYYVVLQK